MCGIVGILSTRPVVGDIVAVLRNLEYRGYDSSGIAVIDNGKVVISKDTGYVSNLNVDRSLQGTIGIGHCRWATHGDVKKENAHPFADCTGKLAIVHNGIIDNYEELKKQLGDSHLFTSDTDSEVIVHQIERYMTGFPFDEAFRGAVNDLTGSYAIIAIHADYPYLMVACKESPLLVASTDYCTIVASDAIGLPDNGIRHIPDGAVERIDMALSGSGCDSLAITAPSKGDYAHYMLKEIYEQPETILATLDQDKRKLTGVALDILRARDVILTACGTSRFATIIGRYLFASYAKKFSEHVVGSELHYFATSFSNSTLVMAVSQSGETADVLNGVRLARQKGSRIISIVNRRHSSLESLSDTTIFMNCGDEVAVASTKSFTSELIVFYLLSFIMADCYDTGIAELQHLPDKVGECLKHHDIVATLANKIKSAEHIYYIGKGINFAVAGECALKLKEVSYIHTESMSAGELKHGTLPLISIDTPVIGICPNDNTYQETIANLHEAKARGGLIIGISDRDNSVFDYWVPIPEVKGVYYPVVSVIIGQLLAYYCAVCKGLNPDRPRSLAKSVTVR